MKQINSIIRGTLLFLLILGCGAAGCPHALAAAQNPGGSVTDTLTIKVGYWGMSEADFVEKATYHWTELDDQFGGAMETHQQAYSFFRKSDDGGYQTIIDSARGFYIKDLLKYAGINLNDIEGISFYTQDQSIGYFTRFSYEELFGVTRYYFNDLSYYVQQAVDEKEKPTGEYSIDPAVWQQAVAVEPMLALEDGWLSYEPGNEHTAPIYTGLSTGNRFRLLFGQTRPDESRTNQTAKYTHSLYIALNGTPKITTEEVELAGQIGSGYTTEFTMSTSDDSFNDALKQFMQWNSSDENVLKITNVELQDDPQYEDAVHVRITYDILSNGNASISGSFFGAKVSTRNGKDEIQMKPSENSGSPADSNEAAPAQQEEKNPQSDPEETGEPDDQSSSTENTEESGSSGQTGSSSSGGNQRSRSAGSASFARPAGSAGVTEDRNRAGSSASIGSADPGETGARTAPSASTPAGSSRNSDMTAGQEQKERNDPVQEADPVDSGVSVYELNGEIGKLLRGVNSETQPTTQTSDPDYEALEVQRSETPGHGASILISVILLMAVGAAIGILRYLQGFGAINIRRGRLKYV